MTDLFETPEEELANFLGSYFHQDMGSPEQALEEYIAEEDKEWIQVMANYAQDFLKSDRSEQEKTDFIESNVEIYFPAIGLTAIQWLEHVIQRLREAVKSK